MAAGAVGAALAAPLGLQTAPLGAAAAPVLRCDEDGFTYAFTTSGGNVTAVTVGDVADPGCEGGVLRVTLTGGGGGAVASAGPATVPTDGDSAANAVTLATDAQPAATGVTGVRAVLEGP